MAHISDEEYNHKFHEGGSLGSLFSSGVSLIKDNLPLIQSVGSVANSIKSGVDLAKSIKELNDSKDTNNVLEILKTIQNYEKTPAIPKQISTPLPKDTMENFNNFIKSGKGLKKF